MPRPSLPCFASSFSSHIHVYISPSSSAPTTTVLYILPSVYPCLSSISSYLHPNLLYSSSSPHLSSSLLSSYLLSQPPLTCHHFTILSTAVTQIYLLHFHISNPLCAYPFPISSFILLHCPPVLVFFCPLSVFVPPVTHVHLLLFPHPFSSSPPPPCSFLHHLPSNLSLFSSSILSTFFILHFLVSSILLHAPHHQLFACPSSPSTSYHLPSLLILPNLTFHLYYPFHHLPSPSPSISYFFLHLSPSVTLHFPLFPILFPAVSPLALSLSHSTSGYLTILSFASHSFHFSLCFSTSPHLPFPPLSVLPTSQISLHPSLTSSHPFLPHSSLSNCPHILLHLLPLSRLPIFS